MTASGNIAAGNLTFAGGNWGTAAGTANTAITIDSLGNISPTTLTVPNTANSGNNTVRALDSGAVSATKTFTVTQPTVSISAESGYRGDVITVTGAGWVPGALGIVQVQVNAVTVVTSIPDAAGNFTASVTIPATALASNLIRATDNWANTSAPAIFTLSPAAVTLDPESGPVATQVTVTGVGFTPQSGLTALTIGAANVLPTTPIVTDTVGKFSTTFTVPGLASGAQTVTATVVNAVSTFFTVVAAPPTVTAALSSVAGKYTKVWAFAADTQSWLLYDTAAPQVSDLEQLVRGQGYWMDATEDCTILYGGNSYTLKQGWNLIGWLG
jgi:hypothetical protein